MTILIRSAFYLLAALCAAILTHSLLSWLLDRPPSIARSLQDFAVSPSKTPPPEVPIGSSAHKIRLAFESVGLEVSGRERFSLYLACCILSLVLVALVAVLRLPPLIWLCGPAIAYFAINSLVKSQWDRLCRRLEKEIPSYLMNLASVIQLNANLIQALGDASLALDPRGALKPWIERLASNLQSHGRQGLEDMQREALDISPSLLLMVVEIGRLWETGGMISSSCSPLPCMPGL